jgi:hypothetical protein
VSGIVLLAVAGAAAGYYGGELTGPATVREAAPAAPLSAAPTPEQLPRKIPEPNALAALKTNDLAFRQQSFTRTSWTRSGCPWTRRAAGS